MARIPKVGILRIYVNKEGFLDLGCIEDNSHTGLLQSCRDSDRWEYVGAHVEANSITDSLARPAHGP
jgi:hypothetical protein